MGKKKKGKHPIIEKDTLNFIVQPFDVSPCVSKYVRLKKKKKKGEKKRSGGSSSPPGTWKSGNTSRLNADDPRL